MAQLFQFGQTKLPSAEAQRLRGANSHGARAVGAGATGVAALKFQGSQGVKSLGAWLWFCAHASRSACKYPRPSPRCTAGFGKKVRSIAINSPPLPEPLP